MNRHLPLIGFLTLALAGCTSTVEGTDTTSSSAASSMQASSLSSSAFSESHTSSVAVEVNELPAQVSLDVPFAPQAPFANWDELHEETCEEMSLIMVEHFWNKTPLSLQTAEDEVQAMVADMSADGLGYDVNVEELATVAEKRGLNAEVDTDVSEVNLKRHLAAGNPVIIPAAGRMLGNPYFSGEGPWYHMLVVTGYKEGVFGTKFITNDPGTKRGEGFEYSSSTLLNAIHDWTGVKEDIAQGRKAVLIVKP